MAAKRALAVLQSLDTAVDAIHAYDAVAHSEGQAATLHLAEADSAAHAAELSDGQDEFGESSDEEKHPINNSDAANKAFADMRIANEAASAEADRPMVEMPKPVRRVGSVVEHAHVD